MSVYIDNESGAGFSFHYRVLITRCVEAVMQCKQIPETLDVNVLIVAAERMQEINRDQRGIDAVTDVLSFPYFEFRTPGCFDRDEQNWTDGDILGDIVLCAEKILSQAQEYGHSQKREMAFLTVHSMLHLTGYDHMNEEDREVMEEEQRRFMDLLQLSR